jgi:hypothetical protein
MIQISVLRAAGLSDSRILAVLEFEQNERSAARREQNRINKQNQRSRQQKNADIEIPEQNQRSCHQLNADIKADSKIPEQNQTPCHQKNADMTRDVPSPLSPSSPPSMVSLTLSSLTTPLSPPLPPSPRDTRARATPLPENFNPPVAKAARKLDWTQDRIEAETMRFKNHALAKDARYVDWEKAWWNWLTSPYQNGHANGGSGNGKAPNGLARALQKLKQNIAEENEQRAREAERSQAWRDDNPRLL